MSLANTIIRDGYAVVPDVLAPETIEQLIEALEISASKDGSLRKGAAVYGARNLLRDVPAVRALAVSVAVRSMIQTILGTEAFAVRGLFFDKTPAANWMVDWHQDRAIAVCEQRDVPGFTRWTVKAGVPHVQPPVTVLEQMLTVRLHLDDTDNSNGALRVIPGSHRVGIIHENEINTWTRRDPPATCLVARGGAMVMRPLLLHASSKATRPAHRRVLHLEFASQSLPGGLEWASSN